MIWRVAGAVLLIAALLAVPGVAAAQAVAPGVPCIGIGCATQPGGVLGGGGSLFCPSSKSSQVPPVRFSGESPSLSVQFDGAPADTGGAPATTIYQTRGVHPLSFSEYDEGCGGPISQLVQGNGVDTMVGNWELGAATDLAALANATHRYATHPQLWMAPIDALEVKAVAAVSSGVWDAFISLSLLILALVIWARNQRGDVAGSMHSLGWAFAVFALVVVVIASPLRVTHGVANAETQMVNIVDGAVAGQQATNPSAPGDLAMDNILYPAWLEGEFGSSTSPMAKQYGTQLLDATSATWAEAGQKDRKAVTKAKHDAFMKVATAIHDADPDAYANLKGQAGGRIGTGFWALAGMALTAPFRIFADLLAMGALILLAVTAVFLPVLGLLGMHERFEPMFRRTIDVVVMSVATAVLFSGAAGLQLVATGFLIGPGAAIPLWVGLFISALLAVGLIFLLRPIHAVVSMAPASTRAGARRVAAAAGGFELYRSFRNNRGTREAVEEIRDDITPERVRETERSPQPEPMPRPERVAGQWGDWDTSAPATNGHHTNGSTMVDDPITTTVRERPPGLDEQYEEPVRRELLPPEEEAS